MSHGSTTMKMEVAWKDTKQTNCCERLTFYDGQLLAVLPGVYNLLLFNPDGSINEAEATENEFGLEALDIFKAFRALFCKIISLN